MRFLVCSGMEGESPELFKAAETVPGVEAECLAIVLTATFSDVFFFCSVVIQQSSKDHSHCAAVRYA